MAWRLLFVATRIDAAVGVSRECSFSRRRRLDVRISARRPVRSPVCPFLVRGSVSGLILGLFTAVALDASSSSCWDCRCWFIYVFPHRLRSPSVPASAIATAASYFSILLRAQLPFVLSIVLISALWSRWFLSSTRAAASAAALWSCKMSPLYLATRSVRVVLALAAVPTAHVHSLLVRIFIKRRGLIISAQSWRQRLKQPSLEPT